MAPRRDEGKSLASDIFYRPAVAKILHVSE